MITVYVLNETPRNEELAEQIQRILTEAMPAVEKVTGLPLPDNGTVDLVDPEGLGRAWCAFLRRQLARDTAGLDLSDRQQRWIAAMPEGARMAMRRFWKSEISTLIANSAGRPSTLLIPEALDLQGLTAPDQLCELLVHALAQQAQVAACDGNLVPPPAWPQVRASRNVVSLLSTGHAQWTSDQATPLILGKPVTRDRRSPLKAALRVLNLGSSRQEARAKALVGQAMSAVGPDTFNRVWSVAGLVPTLDELRDPARWIKRLPA
ncbi:zinc-dependent metalloprotease [Streptomyces sp. NRRL F-5527]|uniref:zinc-dependent metalloprotease n=1 Tax=Streptomyces sp. NRRL F-5527 TaxID=1463862 RepID=UPI0004C623ED|nr:zinc-dependent metalloprotease [Streptomyces sp. NRRL F-5527]